MPVQEDVSEQMMAVCLTIIYYVRKHRPDLRQCRLSALHDSETHGLNL